MSYYNILGVPDKATNDEIKKAYRRLASQHHPDKGGDKARFQEIQQAYDTLSDNNRRQQYDMQLNGFGGGDGVRFHWRSSDMDHPDISEIFRNFGFGPGADPFGQFRQRERRNKDLRVEIPITLKETLSDQTKTISVQTTNGERSTVEVNIPRGVTSGTQIKYTGAGDNLFNTIPRGDLYVQFSVQNNPGFVANGLDLYVQTSVNCFEAIVGKDVEIVGLDDKVFSVSIPPGTQTGTRFRLAGQGLYQMNSSVRGNLYVELLITIPDNLSDSQLEIVRSLINNQ